MTLSKPQILLEMGLSPLWELREQASVVRDAPERVLPASTLSPAAPAVRLSDRILPAPPSAHLLPKVADSEQSASIAHSGWDQLETGVAACRACGLCEQRRQAVLGVGDRAASWLFIGEGPGAEEDAQGEPFVGPAGQLLDSMLAAIGLARQEDVYIANAVKCRPPANRTPEAVEIAACRPYLERQIALIQPKLIVLLGRAAAHAVLRKDDTLSSMRGKTFEYRAGERSIPLIVTYHPAYLLRTLPDKAKSWEDLCRARALMREAKRSGTETLAL
jgi:DNA polymerase